MQEFRIGTQLKAASFRGAMGAARADITPPVGIRSRQWGPSEWSASEGIHWPLTLTTLALADSPDGDPVLLIAMDAGWWRRVDDERRVRGTVLGATGLDEARVLITLSHTHAGPVLCSADVDLEAGQLLPAYLDMLAESASAASRKALAEMQPGVLEWSAGSCRLAGNRDLDVASSAYVGFNPNNDADDTVLVGRVTADSGDVIATVVNYACHPTTLAWQNRLLSPDYVGAMRETVEAQTDGLCVFLQGASGDLAPREQYTGDPEVADRHGMSLGHAVVSTLNSMPPAGTSLRFADVVESGAPLAVWEPAPYRADNTLIASMSGVEMQLQDLPSIEQLEAQWSEIDRRARRERIRRARHLRDGYITGSTVIHPVWAWRLGGALLVAHPGEAYSHFQEELRARFPGVPVVVMNLTNGPGFVYVATSEAYDRGAYPAWQSPLAVGSLERLEGHAFAMLRSMFSEGLV